MYEVKKMPNSKLDQLKRKSGSWNAKIALHEEVERLNNAFEVFSEESARVEKAYLFLKKKFIRINRKLEYVKNELHQKIEALDATTFYLNALLNNISQGILFIKPGGVISTYNPSAQEILQKDFDQVIGRNFWQIFSDDFFGFSVRNVLHSQKAPETVFVTISFENGMTKDLEVCSKSNFEEGLSSKGLMIIIRDISEIRRLQMIANRHDRMEELGEMAATLAHEIRNPLGGIEGFAALLFQDLEKNPEMQKMASYIIEGTRSLNRLVSNVLHYARPMKLRLIKTDLIRLTQQVIEIIKADSSFSSQIQYELDCKSPQIIVPLDEELMKTALLNLVVNAAQAMPGGGILQIKLEASHNMAVIIVADSGAGILEVNMEKIFSPFFSTKEEGNGLGLAEVQKVIQAHGGSITVESKVSIGSKFTIKLPLPGK